MTLLDDLPKLREMEQGASSDPWNRGNIETGCIAARDGIGEVILRFTNDGDVPSDENARLIMALRNAAPAMIEVLSCFEERDALNLGIIVEWMKAQRGAFAYDHIKRLERMQWAASLMEGKGDE